MSYRGFDKSDGSIPPERINVMDFDQLHRSLETLERALPEAIHHPSYKSDREIVKQAYHANYLVKGHSLIMNIMRAINLCDAIEVKNRSQVKTRRGYRTPNQLFMTSGKAKVDEHLQGRILKELELEQKLKRRRNGKTYLLDLAAFCEIGDSDEFQNFLYNVRLMVSTMKIVQYKKDGRGAHFHRLPKKVKHEKETG